MDAGCRCLAEKKNAPMRKFIPSNPRDGGELAFSGEDAALKGGATKARYKARTKACGAAQTWGHFALPHR